MCVCVCVCVSTCISIIYGEIRDNQFCGIIFFKIFSYMYTHPGQKSKTNLPNEEKDLVYNF